jgi:hypothetical protein
MLPRDGQDKSALMDDQGRSSIGSVTRTEAVHHVQRIARMAVRIKVR